MPTYRKLIIIISNNLFRLLLFFTISIIAAVFIYTDRSYVTSVFERNNLYNRVVSSLIETNKEQSLTVGGEVTLEDPRIQEIIQESFQASEIEYHLTTMVEAVYSWLEQDTSEIDFTINLTDNKQRLAEGLSNFAITRLQELPVCTESIAQIDPFSATCQPPFIDYETERVKLEEQLLTESGFLENPVIDSETILSNGSDKPFEEQYAYIPTFYSLARRIPIYITLLLLALALLVIFSSSTKKKGMRKIGYGLVGAGSSLVFFTVLFSFVLPAFTGSLPVFQSTGQGIDALLNDIAIDFGRDYSWMIIKISAPLIIIGAILIFYAQTGKNKKNYKSAKFKSGVVSSNEDKKKTKKIKKNHPPIQSSESSDTKPKRKLKNKNYRKIPKKEL